MIIIFQVLIMHFRKSVNTDWNSLKRSISKIPIHTYTG